MSIITEPYMCNVCKRVKDEKDSNWLVAKVNADTRIEYPFDPNKNIVITTWNEHLVERQQDRIAHLCGPRCAREWVAQQIDILVEPETVEVVAATLPPDETKLKVVSPLS